MVGHVVQRLAECKAQAMILVLGIKAYWFPRVQLAAARSVEVAAINVVGAFRWPSLDGTFKSGRYPKWVMTAYEVDFCSSDPDQL